MELLSSLGRDEEGGSSEDESDAGVTEEGASSVMDVMEVGSVGN